jgi:pSer/pThr/pTyr-binding forkhead associated (FHA) protein
MTPHFTGDQSHTGHRPAPADALDDQLSGASAANLVDFSGTANLVVVGGPNNGVLFPISGEGLTLGRLPDNDVVIDDPWVSRRHAEIISTHDSYVLRDLSSSNGTFLTDRLIDTSDCGLQDGDHIRLGQSDVQLVFRFSGAATLRMASHTGGDELVQGSGEATVSPPAPANASEITGPDSLTVREDRESHEKSAHGEVRLNIEARGDLRLIYQFVHELRLKPELSVLRISGGPEQKVAVWLGLANGATIEPLLSGMQFVSDVSRDENPQTGGQSAETVFNISLVI